MCLHGELVEADEQWGWRWRLLVEYRHDLIEEKRVKVIRLFCSSTYQVHLPKQKESFMITTIAKSKDR